MKILLLLLILACVYFLPALIAYTKKHEKKGTIAKINLTLGWTVIVWLLLLVWVSNNKVEKIIGMFLERIIIKRIY